MKKILMLGASHFQVPAIKYARKAGYYVITADNKPENPGHAFSNEYHNISTVEKEEILELAEFMQIDGILSYASDPGAPTAAYVAEKLSLPGNPYQSVLILQRKDLFRKFLQKHGFNVPLHASFKSQVEAKKYAEHLLESSDIIIKPVDSSGSKGVTKLSSLKSFDEAFLEAKKFSITGRVIIEQFISKKSYQMDGDGFVWNGRLVFSCFGTQHNNVACAPNAPIAISFPYIEREEIQDEARRQIDKIMNLLNMKVGGLNIEFIIDNNDQIYILEIGPRSGGNLIPEVIKYATGVDLIAYAVDGAMGKDCSGLTHIHTKGFYSSYILHSGNDGVFKKVIIDNDLQPHIVEKSFLIKEGDKVERFKNSSHTLGTFIMKFEEQSQMISLLQKMNEKIQVVLN